MRDVIGYLITASITSILALILADSLNQPGDPTNAPIIIPTATLFAGFIWYMLREV